MLDSYDAERHPVGRQVLRTSGALLRLGLTRPHVVGAARTVLAPAVSRIPFITERMAGAVSRLRISYPHPRWSHPLTGQRVPDWPLAGGRRLYEALRGG